MEYIQGRTQKQIHGGHIGSVLMVALLLLGISWMKNPGMFAALRSPVKKSAAQNAKVPRYYAYVPPAENLPGPMVAGASTNGNVPSIINEDGSITPVDMGQVLGASVENVQLSLDNIAVKEIPDSDSAIKQYFTDAQNIESAYINNSDFQTALSSGNQAQIDQQAKKLLDIISGLEQLSVPRSLVKLQKLKIIQYQAGVGLLNNFTKADNNPVLVGQYLDQFLKSQKDMDAENLAIQQKFNIELGYGLPENAQ